jgi:hypothetical protein
VCIGWKIGLRVSNSSINTVEEGWPLKGAWGKEGRIHKIEICTVRSLTIYINKLRGSCEADAVAAVPDYDKNYIASNLSVTPNESWL